MSYPELSPPETSIIFATYFSDIAPWRALNEGEEQVSRMRRGKELHTLPVRRGHGYHTAKRRVADAVVKYLDKKYPGLNDAIVVRDSSSPLTQVRYTGNYNGTVLGWQPFVKSGETLEEEIKRHGPGLPGLKNFYISGVWATTGGLIRAAASGRHVMQFICRDDQKKFTATIGKSAPLPTHIILPASTQGHSSPVPKGSQRGSGRQEATASAG